MEFYDYIIDLQTRDEIIELLKAGDSHIGSLNFAKRAFEKWADYMTNNHRAYTILMGDIFDSIVPDDKRYYIPNIDKRFNSIDKAKNYFINLVEPFKNRIIGMHQGNHERVLDRRFTSCPVRDCCVRLSEPIRDESGKPMMDKEGNTILDPKHQIKYLYVVAITTIKLRYKEKIIKKYDIFSTHGSGGGSSLGGKVNKLMRYSNHFKADAYFSGHVHEAFSGTKPIIKKVGKHGVAEPRIYAFTMSFLKSYVDSTSGYEETKNYPPLTVGYLKTKIDRKKIYKPEEVEL